MLDYSRFPIPKTPDRPKPEVKKDGRTVLNARNWQNLRKRLCLRAEERCELCGDPTPLSKGDAHHKNRRGLGGGKRNDDPSLMEWLCRWCHGKEHSLKGSKRLNGKAPDVRS